jgi:hypothetical protein
MPAQKANKTSAMIMGERMTPDAESIHFRPAKAENRVARPLGVDWIHGSVSAKHNTDPDIQVHWYDEAPPASDQDHLAIAEGGGHDLVLTIARARFQRVA